MNTAAPELPAVGDQLELTVGEVAHGGWCVARPDPGPAGPGEPGPGEAPAPISPVIFVRHALPGERVRVVVTQTTSRFARADAVQVLSASPDRVPPPCPHARPGGCGGCDWQHASPAAQRALKAGVVRQQLRRIAGLERDVTVEALPGDEAGLGWRTRVKFAVRSDGVPGLRRHRSHEVLEVGSCPIAHPLVSAAGVTARTWLGASAVEVAAAPGSGERAVIVAGSSPLARIAAETVPEADQPVLPDTVLSGRAVVRGTGYLHQRAAGRDWRVSAAGFWQVHPGAADTLAAAVLDALRPQPGDVALDVYCGAGLFAGVLAEAVGPSGRVIGIEADAAAVRDARHNLRATPWARVHRGDAASRAGAERPVRRLARRARPAAVRNRPAGHRPAVGTGPGGGRARQRDGSGPADSVRVL